MDATFAVANATKIREFATEADAIKAAHTKAKRLKRSVQVCRRQTEQHGWSWVNHCLVYPNSYVRRWERGQWVWQGESLTDDGRIVQD